jgi:ATP-dependent Clp protease adaptor protein ClpS
LNGYIRVEIHRNWHYVKCLNNSVFTIMSDFDPFKDKEGDLAVQEAKPKLKRPPLYKVILLNDDFTPMDFVIEILMDFFAMSEEKATQVMLHVHTQGVGVCGTYSKDVAETKVYIVNDYSREHHHPLMCSMEEV